MVVASAPSGFEAWRERVEASLLAVLGRDSVALEAELGPLPLQLGWESGDSPEELVAAAVVPLVEESEAEVMLP
jgi:hypothetical protein